MSSKSHPAETEGLPSDAAPAYTTGAGDHHGTSERTDLAEDEFAILKHVDSVLVCDDSGSMNPQVFGPADEGRFAEMRSALQAVVPKLVEYDEDGIDLYWLNSDQNGKNLKTAGDVLELFSKVQPGGTTPLGGTLRSILTEYWKAYRSNKKANKSTKPINIIAITDGAADDGPDLKETICESMLNIHLEGALHYQVGIFLFQMGNPEKVKDTPNNRYVAYRRSSDNATAFLRELDDSMGDEVLKFLAKRLGEAKERKDNQRCTQIQTLINGINDVLSSREGLQKYDIVDTTKLEQLDGQTLTLEGIKKVVLGSLRKSLDVNSKGTHQ
ncbi:hypothetical protein GGR57DRAFT_516997 [Xylariaceae sp. FL1272]|nr:hypothetical protein GGR57DRAFT_516997 [Xylariaceae sp. FL1272]